ncbi:MAG: peptide deformylase [Deltaproteobacteria bacterium]|nr:peptide deformylase [Deltaproteobacteria bacterium]
MTVLEIRTYPDEVLAGKAAPIASIDADTLKLLDDMVETMYSHSGVGLAAPQVGRPVRIIVVDCTRAEEKPGFGLLEMINPEITASSGEISFVEGCLSLPGVETEIKRKGAVDVSFSDRAGNRRSLRAEGILSICVQHEIDHLDGLLFVDRANRFRKKLILREYLKKKRGETA